MLDRRLPARGLLLVILSVSPGCGRSSSLTPVPTPTPDETSTPMPPLGVGARLAFLSGETGEPVAHATLSVNGKTLTTDARGEAELAEEIAGGSSMAVTAEGYLERRTVLRSPDALTFRLWPRRSPTGLDEEYTAALVYTDSTQAAAPVGAAPLYRMWLGTRQVKVVPGPEIAADALAMAAHRDAVDALNAATHGEIAYAVGAERGPDVTFETKLDPGDKNCSSRIRAFTQLEERGQEVMGGRIVFCSVEAVRSSTVTHELGHTYGLQHSPDPNEVMYTFHAEGRGVAFSAREALAMSLMLQRRGGNRYPDRDADAVAARRSVRTITCR